MQYKSRKSGGYADRFPTRRAVERRLRLAFPELTKLLPLLTVAHTSGTPWRAVFDRYTGPLSRRLTAALAQELEDVFSIGLTEMQLDVVAGALGLDRQVALGEAGSVYAFLSVLEERVRTERVARGSRARSRYAS